MLDSLLDTASTFQFRVNRRQISVGLVSGSIEGTFIAGYRGERERMRERGGGESETRGVWEREGSKQRVKG